MGNPFYPLGVKNKPIGLPYQGTHTLYGNWESDNAVDIPAPVGTPVYAVTSGTIGQQIGALSSGDPKLAGMRLHLVSKGNEFYYAHMSQIVVQPGQKVRAGQLLGFSGSANGVAHLHFGVKNGNPLKLLNNPVPKGGAVTPDLEGEPPAPTQAEPLPPRGPLVGGLPYQPDSLGSQVQYPGTQNPDVQTLPTKNPASSTWQLLASQDGASMETLRYAQLASQLDQGG